MATTLEETQKETLSFMDELKHVEAAARVSMVTIVATVTSLDAGVCQIKDELVVLKNNKKVHENDNFIKVMEVKLMIMIIY